ADVETDRDRGHGERAARLAQVVVEMLCDRFVQAEDSLRHGGSKPPRNERAQLPRRERDRDTGGQRSRGGRRDLAVHVEREQQRRTRSEQHEPPKPVTRSIATAITALALPRPLSKVL